MRASFAAPNRAETQTIVSKLTRVSRPWLHIWAPIASDGRYLVVQQSPWASGPDAGGAPPGVAADKCDPAVADLNLHAVRGVDDVALPRLSTIDGPHQPIGRIECRGVSEVRDNLVVHHHEFPRITARLGRERMDG